MNISIPGFSISRHPFAKGTHAQVYFAYEKKKGKLRALKCFNEGKEAAADRELAILKKLDHPHVLQVQSSGVTVQGQSYLLFPFQDSGNLFDFLKCNPKHKLSENTVHYLFRQIVFASEYLHRQEIVHADHKLENCLLHNLVEGKVIQPVTQVMIADFSMSLDLSRADADDLLLRPGSPHYTAPELSLTYLHPLLPQSKKAGTSDLWNLGIILYALVAKALPLPVTWSQLMQMIQDQSLSLYQYFFADYAASCQTVEQFQERILDDLEEKAAPRVHFRVPPEFKCSESLQDLLGKLLQPIATKRITYPQIRLHPWFLFAPTPLGWLQRKRRNSLP